MGGEEGRRQLKELPFRRKPESLRRSRIRRQATLNSASRKILAVARMRFRLSPEWNILFSIVHSPSTSIPSPIPFLRRQESLPASAGNSAKQNGRLAPNAAIRRRDSGFAGMEEGDSSLCRKGEFMDCRFCCRGWECFECSRDCRHRCRRDSSQQLNSRSHVCHGGQTTSPTILCECRGWFL